MHPIDDIVSLALAEDAWFNDITSRALLSDQLRADARIVAKQKLVFSGSVAVLQAVVVDRHELADDQRSGVERESRLERFEKPASRSPGPTFATLRSPAEKPCPDNGCLLSQMTKHGNLR